MHNIYTHTCIRMYVCMYECIYVCIYVCMYVCMHVCMYVRMYVRMHACMHVCITYPPAARVMTRITFTYTCHITYHIYNYNTYIFYIHISHYILHTTSALHITSTLHITLTHITVSPSSDSQDTTGSNHKRLCKLPIHTLGKQ